MSDVACDVVVVGLGPGGEALATTLVNAGLEVVAVEAELVGGECPYWGCIPSKMAIRSANLVAETRRAGVLSGHASIDPDYSVVHRRIRDEATDDWDDSVAAQRLTDAGVRLVRGRGRLVGERQVAVGSDLFDARRAVVLNTGTSAAIPPIDGLATTPYWTNREALRAESAPSSLVVIGGGAIGLELAQAFSRFGSSVTVLEAAPRILAPEEPESSALVRKTFEMSGIGVHEGVSIDAVAHGQGVFHVTTGPHTFEAEQVLVAAGRRARIQDLGLEDFGVDTSGRSLPVDDHLRVHGGPQWLFAIGDVAGRGQFTHVSMYQSARVAAVLTGRDLPDYDDSLPRVTFTDPEIGAVGLTEAQARERGLHVVVGKESVGSSSRGFTHGPGADGFIKVVVDADRGVLVGATSAGPTGGETLSALAVAVRAEVPVELLKNTIYAYPTFWRAIETALP